MFSPWVLFSAVVTGVTLVTEEVDTDQSKEVVLQGESVPGRQGSVLDGGQQHVQHLRRVLRAVEADAARVKLQANTTTPTLRPNVPHRARKQHAARKTDISIICSCMLLLHCV